MVDIIPYNPDQSESARKILTDFRPIRFENSGLRCDKGNILHLTF